MIRAAGLPGDHPITRRLAMAGLVGLCLLGGLRLAQGALIPVKAAVAQILLAHAFDHSLADHRAHKPWPWADMAPAARLGVPRLGISRIVLDTGSGQAMAFGPTLLPDAAPLNTPGMAVIAAHRDTHFRFLKDMAAGDTITIETIDGKTRRYRVTGTQIVRWDRFAIGRRIDDRRLALTTCYPFDAVSHGPLRYVVHARAIQQRAGATRSATIVVRQQSRHAPL